MLRRCILALLTAALLAAPPALRADEFSTNTDDGGGTASPGGDEFNSDGGDSNPGGDEGSAAHRDCPDPRNAKYTRGYGVQPLFLPVEVAGEFYRRDPSVFYRCGFDMCHENSVVCWPRPGATNDFPDLLKYGGVLQGRVSNEPEPPPGDGRPGSPGAPQTPSGGTAPNGTGSQPGIGPPGGSATGTPPAPIQWVNGAFRGFAGCATGAVQSIGDALAAAAHMARGDFVAAEQALGLERGQGTILRTIVAEANAPSVNATPDQAGERVARRICQALLLKAGSLAKGRLKTNPVAAPEVNLNWKNLQGKWVDLGVGQPVKLGRKYGAGVYGAVYENTSAPGTAIKVFKPQNDLSAVIRRELDGYNKLPPEVPRRQVLDVHFPESGKAGVLLMQEVTQAFPGEQVQLFNRPGVGAAQSAAVQQLYQTLGENGLIAGDLTYGNVFGLRNPAGQWRAGILDSDMIFHAKDFAAQPAALQSHVRALLSLDGAESLVAGSQIDAGAVMQHLFRARAKAGEFRLR
jgi:hypothetical protein